MTWRDYLYTFPKATENEMRPFFIAWCTEIIPGVRMFVRNIGQFKDGHGNIFKAGKTGQADVFGWIRGADAHAVGYEWAEARRALEFEIELKNVKTVQTDEQKAWAAFCSEWHIPYLLLRARKGETPYRIVERWAQEASVWIEELRRQ